VEGLENLVHSLVRALSKKSKESLKEKHARLENLLVARLKRICLYEQILVGSAFLSFIVGKILLNIGRVRLISRT